MIATTPDDRFVLATDLGTDQIVFYELDTTTGKLASATHGSGFATTDEGAGPRHFAFAPNGKMLYVINELASTLTVYEYDPERGELRPRQTVSSPPEDFAGENTGAQVLVSPDGRFVYGSNRGHHSITIWSVDTESGNLSLVGHESTRGEGPRNFNIDPTGSWLLAANEKSDTVVTFRRDQESGKLTAVGQPTAVPTPVAILFIGH
jgi:6-phosphogluconolactonase